MRKGGIDLPNASWTPPWEKVPDSNPSPDNPNRLDTCQHFSVIRHAIQRLQNAPQQHQWTTQYILTIAL
eukprot:2586587-Pyramimonas_sp.AAC.1